MGGTAGTAALGCTGPATALDPSVYAARRASSSNRYIPLAIGAHWGWMETNVSTGASGMKQSWVEALDTLTGTKAGVSAYRVHSESLTGGTISWEQDTGTATVRHRTQFLGATGAVTSTDDLVPSQLRLDEASAHLTAGTTWTESYTDTKTRASGAVVSAALTVTWTVEAVNETVTVPAGTFSCIRVHRVEPVSAVDSTGGDNVFWFARGVGKVKETGTVTHELLGYCYP
jgi:hypothetical protein